MAVSRHSLIAQEGMLLIGLSAGAAIALHIYQLDSLALFFWVLTAALIWVHRDPVRAVPPSPLALVSPVDGHVTRVEAVHDPYLKRDALQITLRMSPLGVYSVRSATEGKIMQVWAKIPTDGDTGRGHSVWVQTDEGDDVVIVIRPGRLFGRMMCYLSTGDRIGQGQRCGYIPFGAHVDLYIPANCDTDLKTHDRVWAGVSILAKLVHQNDVAIKQNS